MRTINKLLCRTFHVVEYVIKPLLPYCVPEIYEKVDVLPELLERHNINSILLLTDAQLRRTGVTAPLEKLLDDHGVQYVIYDGTQPNPTVHNIEAARKVYLENNCKGIIAFGGGSPMDCAKALGARIARPAKRVNQMKGTLRVRRPIPPIIAIPTTAGTGSEVTPAAVITDSDNHHKYTVNDFCLTPRYAVLDPKVTVSLPPSLTATTGMDALTHAVEAYIGCSTTAKIRAQAQEAVRLIFENLEKAYYHGDDEEVRKKLLWASCLAGQAFSMAYVGYVHGIAHSLGGQYNIPHGLANSVLLPVVLEVYGESAHRKLHELAVCAGVAKPEDSHAEGAAKFITAIRAMNARMNIPDCFKELQKADIPTMARYAAAESNPLYPVPKLMDAKELENIYYQVADWSKNHGRSEN